MNRLISRCVLAFSASAILSTSVFAADAPSCQNVRMGVVNWTDAPGYPAADFASIFSPPSQRAQCWGQVVMLASVLRRPQPWPPNW